MMTESEKDQEIARLRERCALLDSLLGDASGISTTTKLRFRGSILETFVDRGQLRKLAEPTVLPSGKRIPGLNWTTHGNLR